MRMSKAIAAIGASAAVLFGGPAVNPGSAAEALVAPGNSARGLAVANLGLDPVSLVEQDRRTVGSATYSTIHGGETYRFAIPSNLKKFQARQDQYRRHPGGHCAYGVVVGAKSFGDSRCFKTVDRKRPQALNEAAQAISPEDAGDPIDATTKNWTQITHKDPSDLG